MKKWIESWLIPLVDRVAKTPRQKRIAYVLFIFVGFLVSWFGFTVSQVSTEQLFVLGETPLGQGVLK